MRMTLPAPSLAAALLLLSSAASAARYDPDFDRAALRQAATLAHSGIVDATGLPLEPEKVPAITAGLDEGLRQARLAAGSARSLDDAARRRGEAMEAAVKEGALERALKELLEPVAAERRRLARLSAERGELKEKVEALPEGERKKLEPLLAKAEGALSEAAGALRPLEEAAKSMEERGLEMKSRQRDAAGPLVEISSAAAGTIGRAEDLAPAMAEAKARLAVLGQEPRDVARTRAWEKLDLLRGVVRLLFQDADRACNRADEFRRASSSYERAFDDYDRARRAASAGPSAARSFLDEAHKHLVELRKRLKKD